jgi:putative transposase
MPDFKRYHIPGATYFFTVVTYARRPLFRSSAARARLRRAIEFARERRPFDLPAIVLLPDHLHCMWTLPPGDSDYSTRWRKIKEDFTRAYAETGGHPAGVSPAQHRKGLRGVWQQRFWEHTIRDEEDFGRHLDYIHYNPVKHEYVRCAHEWRWSSFERWIRAGVYDASWCCACRRTAARRPDFAVIADTVGE